MGHRDFDVEKKLRRDLKRTHALLADAQLLLSTVDSQAPNLPNGSREQIERLHCQVGAGAAPLTNIACPKMSVNVLFGCLAGGQRGPTPGGREHSEDPGPGAGEHSD